MDASQHLEHRVHDLSLVSVPLSTYLRYCGLNYQAKWQEFKYKLPTSFGQKLAIGFTIELLSLSLVFATVLSPKYFLQLVLSLGVVVAQWINLGAQALDPWGWRLSLALAGLPAIVLTLGGIFLPETPNSLIERGKVSISVVSITLGRTALCLYTLLTCNCQESCRPLQIIVSAPDLYNSIV